MTLLGLTVQPTRFRWKMGPIAVLPKDALERIFQETAGGFLMAESAGFAQAKNYGLVSAKKIVKRACRGTVGQWRPPRVVLADEVAPELSVDWDCVFDPAVQVGEARTIDDRFLDDTSVIY